MGDTIPGGSDLPVAAYVKAFKFLHEHGRLPGGFYWDNEAEKWRDPFAD